MTCLLNLAITTAATTNSTPFRLQRRDGYRGVTAQMNFTYGSGGTTVDATLQTSFDGGNTWVDIWHCTQFTTASARRGVCLPNVTATSSTADVDFTATLTAAHSLDGAMGDQLRCHVVSTGTYAATTLQCDIFASAMTQLAE